jgi:hypothetical protein
MINIIFAVGFMLLGVAAFYWGRSKGYALAEDNMYVILGGLLMDRKRFEKYSEAFQKKFDEQLVTNTVGTSWAAALDDLLKSFKVERISSGASEMYPFLSINEKKELAYLWLVDAVKGYQDGSVEGNVIDFRVFKEKIEKSDLEIE